MFRYVHWTQRSCPWNKEPYLHIEVPTSHDLIQAIISRQRATCMICKRQNVNIHHSRDGRLRCETCFKKYANSIVIPEEIEYVETCDKFIDGSDVPCSGEYQ